MLAVVRCLHIASLSAGRRVIALTLTEGEELIAHVCVVAVLIKRSIDCAAKFLRAGEAVDGWWWGVLIVTVGASDDNLEAVSPLTLVGSFGRGDRCTPEGTFEVGGGWRVRAVL